jgi:predicted  nucleic acid-binding Zn-ribbon protein
LADVAARQSETNVLHERRIEVLDNRSDKLEQRVDKLEHNDAAWGQRLVTQEQRSDRVEQHVVALEQQDTALEKETAEQKQIIAELAAGLQKVCKLMGQKIDTDTFGTFDARVQKVEQAAAAQQAEAQRLAESQPWYRKRLDVVLVVLGVEVLFFFFLVLLLGFFERPDVQAGQELAQHASTEGPLSAKVQQLQAQVQDATRSQQADESKYEKEIAELQQQLQHLKVGQLGGTYRYVFK